MTCSGILKAVSKRLFHSEIQFKVTNQTVVPMLDGHTQHHVTFLIDILDDDTTASRASLRCTTSHMNHVGQTVSPLQTSLFHAGSCMPMITPKVFCELFPFHIVFNSDLLIQQCGTNLQKMRPLDLYVGRSMSDVFTLVRPQIPFTFDYINRFINASFVLQLVDATSVVSPCDENKPGASLQNDVTKPKPGNPLQDELYD